VDFLEPCEPLVRGFVGLAATLALTEDLAGFVATLALTTVLAGLAATLALAIGFAGLGASLTLATDLGGAFLLAATGFGTRAGCLVDLDWDANRDWLFDEEVVLVFKQRSFRPDQKAIEHPSLGWSGQ